MIVGTEDAGPRSGASVQVEVPVTITRRALQLDLALFESGQSDASARRSFPGVSWQPPQPLVCGMPARALS